MAEWVKNVEGGAELLVRATPRASRNEAAGVLNGALKVRLRAPPVDGKANAALREFLAEALGVPERAVVLAAGETARLKRVRVAGVTAAAVEAAFSA